MGNKHSSPRPLAFEATPTPQDVALVREKDNVIFADAALAAKLDMRIINEIFKDTTNPNPLPRSVYIYIEDDAMKHRAYEFINRHVIDKLRRAGWQVTSLHDSVTSVRREALRWRRNMSIVNAIIGGGYSFFRVTVVGIVPQPVKKTIVQTPKLCIYKQAECVICLADTDTQYIILPCGHANYCTTCVETLTGQKKPTSCPVCRESPVNVCKIMN